MYVRVLKEAPEKSNPYPNEENYECSTHKVDYDIRGILITLNHICDHCSQVYIKLPDDGQVVFIMNNNGDTIHTYRWSSTRMPQPVTTWR